MIETIRKCDVCNKLMSTPRFSFEGALAYWNREHPLNLSDVCSVDCLVKAIGRTASIAQNALVASGSSTNGH
jgi:hypothetical protein